MIKVCSFNGFSHRLIVGPFQRHSSVYSGYPWPTRAEPGSHSPFINQGNSGTWYYFQTFHDQAGDYIGYVVASGPTMDSVLAVNNVLYQLPWPPLGYVATGQAWNLVWRGQVYDCFNFDDVALWLDAH